jgi:NAD(P)-dependent dehydrogenase (short-subunit alcohol dehydrogenase family)
MSHERIALVTGASRGIGRGIAVALAAADFHVVVNYANNAAAAEEVKALVEAAGARAHLVRADVSVAADRRRLVDETLATFGRIDLLVNNAGITSDVRGDLLEASEESFDRLINTNLKGPYFLTQLVAREMIKAREEATERRSDEGKAGKTVPSSPSVAPSLLPFVAASPKIINITSISAYAASVHRGDYCVAKAGLSMMTQLYAARLAADGINVYEIRPGIIETDMTGPVRAKYDSLIFDGDLTPIRRWGKPEDVARAVVAVANDALPFSTGEVINVDGGFHMRRL